jgi:Fe-S cluster biogenesis protein NfuA
VEALIAEILQPLLEKDGGGIELVSIGDDEVVVCLTGVLAGDPAAPYVKKGVVEPALATVVGPKTKVVYRPPSFLD